MLSNLSINASQPTSIANPSTTGATLTEFTLFPKLPTELRIKIWKLAVVPRLVTTNPLYVDAIPAIYHTSREARKESNYVFPENSGSEGPVINYDADILFIREWDDPKIFSGVAFVGQSLLYPVKRLAISLISTISISSDFELWIIKTGYFDKETAWNPFLLLEQVCPALEELVILYCEGPLGDGLHEECTCVQLYASYEKEVRDIIPEKEMNQHALLFTGFLQAKANGKWKDPKMAFMRNETWNGYVIIGEIVHRPVCLNISTA